MNIENVYLRLPKSLRNIAVSLEGWRIRRMRFNDDYKNILNEYLSREFAPYEDIKKYSDEKLIEFVNMAIDQVPFYRDYVFANGCAIKKINTVEDIQLLPIISKTMIRNCPDAFKPLKSPKDKVVNAHTSGTTGAGLKFPITRSAHHHQWAAWGRYRRSHGVDENTPCIYLGGRSLIPVNEEQPPYWVLNRPGRQLMFSAYHLRDETAGLYFSAILDSGISWMHGYPSSVATLAAHAIRLGIRWEPTLITVGAETLLPHQSILIEKAFGIKPVQHYGMAEGIGNISQCPKGRMHVDEDFAYMEFIRNADGRYNIVGTNFNNSAFPLIRYSVGDIAVFTSAPMTCDCGRPGRLVSDIDGRIEDAVVTARGDRIGRLDHAFKDMINIEEAQIRQHEPGALNIFIKRGSEYSIWDENKLKYELQLRLGGDMEISFIYVDNVPRTNAGKLRFVISDII